MQKEKESIMHLLNLFQEEMEKRGFEITVFKDKWQPWVMAMKKGHYKIKAIGFLDPSSPGFVTEGTVGLDTRSVFYFQLNPPFDALETRFENMLREMEPFIQKELDQQTLKLEF